MAAPRGAVKLEEEKVHLLYNIDFNFFLNTFSGRPASSLGISVKLDYRHMHVKEHVAVKTTFTWQNDAARIPPRLGITN